MWGNAPHVILSNAKDLERTDETLRCAQSDSIPMSRDD
jgi:hypothetical protein